MFDWPALMAAGVRGLGLDPKAFWALTPAELSVMLSPQTSPAALSRAELDALVAAYPDAPHEEKPITKRDASYG